MAMSPSRPILALRKRRNAAYLIVVYVLGIAAVVLIVVKNVKATTTTLFDGCPLEKITLRNGDGFQVSPASKLPRNQTNNSQDKSLYSSPLIDLSKDEANILNRQKGIYIDNKNKNNNNYPNVLLVTAANYAYMDFYRNWAFHAKNHGFKWVLVALDHRIYDTIISSKDEVHEDVLLADSAEYNLTERSRFRTKSFNLLSCSKLQMVLKIIAHGGSGLDVVFSDPDNVFLKDPFAKGASLGDMIQSQRFDYIYQPNIKNYPPNDWRTKPPHEGNTGFYFVSASRKRQGIQSLFLAALQECQRHPDLDDQTNFWNTFRSVRERNNNQIQEQQLGDKHDDKPFSDMSFCPTKIVEDERTLSYCPMDPFQHPTGYPIDKKEQVITYHGNFCIGKNVKLAKIKDFGAWSWVNDTCQTL